VNEPDIVPKHAWQEVLFLGYLDQILNWPGRGAPQEDLMRVSDNRYQRDRTRLDVALRLIHHEARTRTIRQWTGLSDDRIRKLYRSYLSGDQGVGVRRRRGQSPHQAAFFTGSARLRQQSDLLASLYCLVGMLSASRVADAPRLNPGLHQAQLLCQAFESFGAFVGDASISFEHAAFLVNALANGQELTLAHCRGCGAMVISDRGTLREPRCAVCATDSPAKHRVAGPPTAISTNQ
jgi:hypothetical protein